MDISTNLILSQRSKAVNEKHLHISSTCTEDRDISSLPSCTRSTSMDNTHASLSGSGMLASTLLISDGPKPVKVRLCLGRLNPGPTGPCKSEMGAPTEGLRSWAWDDVVVDDMVVLCTDGELGPWSVILLQELRSEKPAQWQ